jgi:predicted nucleotidyltransferase
MKVAGIICECNPLHAGHLHLLECARKNGADTVVAVMSGCFVQRGEPAVADPFTRAEILVRAGFDAVFELPFPYSASAAEHFGRAGVEILTRLGADEIWFGSECGDLPLLTRLAEIADSEEFCTRYRETADSASGTAQAYFDLLRSMAGEETPMISPNDILALSYLRAIRNCKSSIRPVTIKREGMGYNDTVLQSGFPSATALRLLWKRKGFEAVRNLLPPSSGDLLAKADENGSAPASLANLERAILSHFRMTPPEQLEQIAELGGGLGSRMAYFAHKAHSLDAFLSLCATRKYTDARLRRGILFSLAGIRDEDLRRPVAYARLLAANRQGCAYLSSIRRTTTIPILTRKTDLEATAEAVQAFAIECRSRDLFTLCTPNLSSAEHLNRCTAHIADR